MTPRTHIRGVGAMPITLMLPIPPSTNNIYFNAGRKRVKTQAYTRWLHDAHAMILSQRKPAERVALEIPVAITVTIGTNANKRRDLDNFLKGSLDALVKSKVLQDDKLVHDLRIRWGSGRDVCVDIAPMGVV